jgi:hypothetical protein
MKGGSMRRGSIRVFVVVLTTFAVLLAGGAFAGADPGITATPGAPVKLQDRVVVNVPVTVVCDSLGLTEGIGDFVGLTLQQASGRDITTGTGSLGAPFAFPGAPAFLTCDGTGNTVVVPVLPDAGEGPFHGGGAVITSINARHSEGSGCDPSQGFCSETAHESFFDTTPISVSIKGGG